MEQTGQKSSGTRQLPVCAGGLIMCEGTHAVENKTGNVPINVRLRGFRVTIIVMGYQ